MAEMTTVDLAKKNNYFSQRNKKSDTNALIGTAVLSNWAVTFATIVYALVATPYIVEVLQKELYGVWAFLNSLTAYSQILYFGLGSALIMNVSRLRSTEDSISLNRLVSVIFTIYSLVGLLCLISLVLLSPVLPSLFSNPLDADSYRAASRVVILLGVQVFCIFQSSCMTGVLSGFGRFDLVNLVQLFSIGLRCFAIFYFLDGPDPILRLAMMMTSLTALETLLFWTILHVKYGWIKSRFVLPRLPELKALYSFGLQSFFLIISSKLIHLTDTIVIGILLGSASVSLYALPQQMIIYCGLFIARFASVFLPKLTALYTTSDYGHLRIYFVKSLKISSFLSVYIFVTAIYLGHFFLGLWVGPEFSQSAPAILLPLGIAGILSTIAVVMPLPFFQAMGLLRFPAQVRFVEALSNLILSLLLARSLGLLGVALGTLLPALLFSFLILPRYICRELSIDFPSLCFSVLLPSLVLVLVLSLFFEFVKRNYAIDSWYALLMCLSMTIPIPVLVGWVAFSRGDKQWLKSLTLNR